MPALTLRPCPLISPGPPRNSPTSTHKPPDYVARTVLATLQDENPAFRIQTSAGARQFVAQKLSDLERFRDELQSMARWLREYIQEGKE